MAGNVDILHHDHAARLERRARLFEQRLRIEEMGKDETRIDEVDRRDRPWDGDVGRYESNMGNSPGLGVRPRQRDLLFIEIQTRDMTLRANALCEDETHLAATASDIDDRACLSDADMIEQPFSRGLQHARDDGEPVASELTAPDRIRLERLGDHADPPRRNERYVCFW